MMRHEQQRQVLIGGIACRYPGVQNVGELWSLTRHGDNLGRQRRRRGAVDAPSPLPALSCDRDTTFLQNFGAKQSELSATFCVAAEVCHDALTDAGLGARDLLLAADTGGGERK